jgi:signal transduction histidine kinase
MSFSFLEDSKKNQEIYDTIDGQLSRGKSLISNIRKLAEFDKAEMEVIPTDLLDYLSRSINFVKESNPQKHIDIKVETVEKKIIIKSNELLTDIFENILVNAVKYNDNTVPKITITISKAELDELNYVKLEFKDNGIGIQDFKKEKIFLEGYKDLKGEKGMGIGLSLITKIINLHKGKIWVEDRIQGDYSKGSNFIMLIPEDK